MFGPFIYCSNRVNLALGGKETTQQQQDVLKMQRVWKGSLPLSLWDVGTSCLLPVSAEQGGGLEMLSVVVVIHTEQRGGCDEVQHRHHVPILPSGLLAS